MKKTGYIRLVSSAAVIGIFATAQAALAQAPKAGSDNLTSSQNQDAADASSEGEIVVTATRRATNLQDVPMSITAITSESLEKKSATSFFDYGSSVPNLSFGNTGLGSSNSRSIAIRGISDADTTGFYIDDTPVPESLDPQIVDVERIEVLRGPQGTLYGARSMGGTVRLITIQPDTNDFSGRAHASLSTTDNSNRPNYAVDGAVNLPVVQDRIGLRVVGVYRYDAGYMSRTFGLTGEPTTTVRDVGRTKTAGASAAALIKVTDNFQITPRILYQETSANGFPYADVPIPSGTQPVVLRPTTLDQRRDFDIQEYSRDKWVLGTFDAKLNTGFGSLNSSTSLFNRRTRDIEDDTDFAQFAYGYPDPLKNAPELDYHTNAVTQEFRFVSDLHGPFNFVAGLFYNHTKTNIVFPPNIIVGLADATGFTGTDLNFASNKMMTQDDYAAYAEGTLEIVPNLKAIAGARLYKTKTSFSATYDGFVNGGPQVVPEQRTNESGVQPKFSLQYQIAPDNQIYATAAKGFRPGGVNGLITTGFGCSADLAALGLTPDDTLIYKSDSVWSYEAGAKTSFADHKVTANLSGFRIDWSGIQQNIGLQCGFSFRGNAGKARSQGFEFALTARPVQGLALNLGLGYVDAKFTTTPAGTNVTAGDRVPQVPKITLSVGGDYNTEISEGVRGFVHGDYRYVGDSVSVLNAATDGNGKIIPRIRPSYNIVDVRGGVDLGNVELAVFAKNLTNELAVLGDARALAAELPGRARVQISQPRTIGVEVRVKY